MPVLADAAATSARWQFAVFSEPTIPFQSEMSDRQLRRYGHTANSGGSDHRYLLPYFAPTPEPAHSSASDTGDFAWISVPLDELRRTSFAELSAEPRHDETSITDSDDWEAEQVAKQRIELLAKKSARALTGEEVARLMILDERLNVLAPILDAQFLQTMELFEQRQQEVMNGRSGSIGEI